MRPAVLSRGKKIEVGRRLIQSRSDDDGGSKKTGALSAHRKGMQGVYLVHYTELATDRSAHRLPRDAAAD
jgi:hypothetical protein